MPAGADLSLQAAADATAGLAAQASAWVRRFAPLIPPGEVLDLACGGGRHSALLARLGHQVCALDRDIHAVQSLAHPAIQPFQYDLENGAPWPFAPARFAGVVVTNYLYRPIFPAILGSVAPGGILLYETFACGNERYGKPSNPDFLLHPGELLNVAGHPGRDEWRVVAFEDGYLDSPKPAMVQRICAMNVTGQSSLDMAAGYPPIF